MIRFFSLNTLRIILTVLLLLPVMGAPKAYADEVTITGKITQSVPEDSTGPAVNNQSLNQIHDNQRYTLTLDFNGSINAPNTYYLTSGFLSVPSALASENFVSSSGSDFSTITVSSANASIYDITAVVCLAGVDCATDFLSLDFAINKGDLNLQNISALSAGAVTSLELFEDSTTTGTDIQATVDGYSYTPTPEPASLALYGTGLIAVGVARRKRQRKSPSS